MSHQITQDEWNYWYNRIYGFFCRRVRTSTEADELTSETLTDFFLKIEKAENQTAFAFGVAKNKLREFIRNKEKNQMVELDYIEELESEKPKKSQYEYDNGYYEKLDLLKKCIEKQLKKVDQDIVELCVECDFSSKRVAEELEMTPVNIRKRLSRAIKKIKDRCKQIWTKTCTRSL